MDQYVTLGQTALEQLDVARAAVERMKAHMGSLDSRESLLEILNELDVVEVSLSELLWTRLNQEHALRKALKERAFERTSLAGKPLPHIQL